jgi:hypothetical protein
MNLRLIDNWSTELHRLWSIRIALFFAALNGVALGLAAFVDVFNPWLFMGLNVIVYTVLIGARLLKQEGAEA